MLASLLTQTYPDSQFEVIVVDNGSSDDTQAVCSNYAEKITNFRTIYAPAPGLHVGRHTGLYAAKGDILVYADDDIVALPTWLEGIYESFLNRPEVALVGGKNNPDFETPPPLWVKQLWSEHNGQRSCALFSIVDLGDDILEVSPFVVWGCNFSIRKSVLLRIGGFNPDGMPKDWMQYRGDGESAVCRGVLSLGYKTLYNPKASVNHFVSTQRMTFDYLYERGIRSGVSASYFRIRTQGKLPFWHAYFLFKATFSTWIAWTKTGLKDQKKQVLKAYQSGFLAGYWFHVNAVKKDPELLKWVLKECYLDPPTPSQRTLDD